MKKKILFSTAFIFAVFIGYSQQLAFPGAEGFGKFTSGGRSGKVYQVTNLNDSGEGSLRAAVEASGSRTVVFRVSGTIELNSVLNINNGAITIAGQTAPGDGICIKNFSVAIHTDNVILRYIRFRLGDEKDQEDDAIRGRNHKDIIIDHCSMSWSVDETASFYDNETFTMQWCILSESLLMSVHEKGNHGYAGIWGGKGVSFHHNLLAHHNSRNPRFCGSRYSNESTNEFIDHRNNVIFNWGGNSCYGAEGGSYNIVNNYYKYGPATSSGIRDRIIAPNADDGSNSQLEGVWGNFYVDGNYLWKQPTTTQDNWKGVDNVSSTVAAQIKLSAPLNYSIYTINTQTAVEAFEYVLVNAGATLPKRDIVDARIVDETRTGNVTYGASNGAGTGIIDTPSDVGGWPVLNSSEPPLDTDSDGMPDEWELLNSLDINDASDGNGISTSGYSNLEVYLNSLVEAYQYMVRPINFVSDSVSHSKVYLSWEDISDNETGFVIERKSSDGEWAVLANTSNNITVLIDTTLTEPGNYLYRMKSVNSDLESFYTDSLVVTIEQEITSIDALKENYFNLKVFPNPVIDIVNVELKMHKNSNLSIKLVDLNGKVASIIVNEDRLPGEYKYTLAGNSILPGVYFIQVQTNEHTQTMKVVK